MLDHIAIATRNAGAMRKLYELIGFRLEKQEEVPSQKVTATFLSLDGIRVELLEPTGDDSSVARAIAKRGEGLHHLAFRVPSLADAMARLKAEGYGFIYEEPQAGAGGRKINFIHPKDGGGVLVELCE